MGSSSGSHADITIVVKGFVNFSKAYLVQKVSTGKFYLNSTILGKAAVDDLAVDSIADLFARDDGDHYFLLERSFSDITEFDDFEIMSRVRQIVTQTTHQNMIAVFRQIDPAGWKIYKNLSAVKERRRNVRTFSDLGTEYYYYCYVNLYMTYSYRKLPPQKGGIYGDVYNQFNPRRSGSVYRYYHEGKA